MAHHTDPGLLLAGPEQPSLGAPSVGGSLTLPNTPFFGDPDQQLFGGSWASPPAPLLGDSGYQGRHRAAE